MRCVRVYQAITLITGSTLELDQQASHHLRTVLRCKVGGSLILFNGQGGEYQATVEAVSKKSVIVSIGEYNSQDRESPLNLNLAQAISRGERMDFVIQKSVELGVSSITPLISERCNVRLSDERSQKRWQHWQKIIISACEQSGRNKLPTLHSVQNFEEWLKQKHESTNFVLDGNTGSSKESYDLSGNAFTVLIGPEGGLTADEITLANQHGFNSLSLGPRILRTETATLVALTVLQNQAGDL